MILGLTGSIGMGKSTTAQMFVQAGVPVHDSDQAAHKALEPNSPIFKAIAKSFPTCWHKKTNTIDRKKLGKIVFNDSEQKTLLESYIHPFVKSEQEKFIKSMRSKGIKTVLLDIPLLFETSADKRVDYTIVASAPFFIQTQRVMARDNMTVEKFNAILKSQMPDQEKRARANYIVHTGLGLSYARKQVHNIITNLSS